ncbi:hypothetical protein Tel_04445 [Candidatus Tenderia electrophaga]|uniref:histidine kinase n=1 Tax=Candidatus Tenderia electrophaga TaxID=1748243 RepID=A0A0S2TBC5_9GAMM|nr:hypothetical protein Tel_04445 [Candidatus Tenderia electrophaga]
MNSFSQQVTHAGDRAAVFNLRRLVFVRLVAIFGEIVVVIAAAWGLGMQLPLLGLGWVIAAHAAVNLFAGWRLRSAKSLGANEFMLQLGLDVIILTTLLYLAGGASNPFISLLVLPLVMAAAVLPKHQVWGMGVLVVAAYGLLMFQHRPMPHVASHAGEDFDWHVIGMWFSFILAVVIIVFFVLRMAESLRERDRVLAEARERSLRDEQLVALGTLAAGAAHELGTPLSTMAILTQELQQEYDADTDLQQRLGILRQQVDRCKATLAMISASSGQLRAEGGGRLRLDRFLSGVVAEWRLRRPTARLEFEMSGTRPAPDIISEQGLRQALITFLDNAADSSPDDVGMRCRWQARHLAIEIADRGAGMPQHYRAQVGKVPFSTKPEGQGLGLMLAHAIIQRLGGTVNVADRPGGGMLVDMQLDLARLLLDE